MNVYNDFPQVILSRIKKYSPEKAIILEYQQGKMSD
jgi:hypothetical protein